MAFILTPTSLLHSKTHPTTFLNPHPSTTLRSHPHTLPHHPSPSKLPPYMTQLNSANPSDPLTPSLPTHPPSNLRALILKTSTLLINLFPLWTLLSALLALRKPTTFLWLNPAHFGYTLGILMLSMGITLTPQDFRRTIKRLGAVTIGFLLCYGLMPALAFILARIFQLPPDLTAGTVLVGAVNGGQASNLCTLIANGDVALSVLMTTSTTLGAIVMTPLLSRLLIGTVVPIDTLGIAISTVQVVLGPIALGMFLNKYANKFVNMILPFTPLVGVVATCVLVGASIAQSATPILAAGISLQLPIMLLHLIGGLLGYFLTGFAGYDEKVKRTVAIETSMKSSAFGFLLATLHFGAYMVRVPSAVSVVWMALVGSCLAVAWRFIPIKKKGGNVTDVDVVAEGKA